MALVCCKAVSTACNGICKGLDTGCGLCSKGISGILCPSEYPSPLFPIGTAILNAGAIYTVIALITQTFSTKLLIWVIGALVVEILNVIFSLYIFYRFYRIKSNNLSLEREGWKLFMYDIGVYLYGWVFIFQLVWIIMGFVWLAGSSSNDPRTVIIWNLALLCVYVIICCPLLLCSLMTECCQQPRWQGALTSLNTAAAGTGPNTYSTSVTVGLGGASSAQTYQYVAASQPAAPQQGYPAQGYPAQGYPAQGYPAQVPLGGGNAQYPPQYPIKGA